MLFAAFGSSCHRCIEHNGGGRPCPRCSGGVKHPAAASFYNMVDVLLAHGLKLNSRLKQEVEEVRICVQDSYSKQYHNTTVSRLHGCMWQVTRHNGVSGTTQAVLCHSATVL
jgi:hypothetical protein